MCACYFFMIVIVTSITTSIIIISISTTLLLVIGIIAIIVTIIVLLWAILIVTVEIIYCYLLQVLLLLYTELLESWWWWLLWWRRWRWRWRWQYDHDTDNVDNDDMILIIVMLIMIRTMIDHDDHGLIMIIMMRWLSIGRTSMQKNRLLEPPCSQGQVIPTASLISTQGKKIRYKVYNFWWDTTQFPTSCPVHHLNNYRTYIYIYTSYINTHNTWKINYDMIIILKLLLGAASYTLTCKMNLPSHGGSFVAQQTSNGNLSEISSGMTSCHFIGSQCGKLSWWAKFWPNNIIL